MDPFTMFMFLFGVAQFGIGAGVAFKQKEYLSTCIAGIIALLLLIYVISKLHAFR